MSRGAVEVVHEYFAAGNRGDFERVMALYAEDVVLRVTAALDGGTYRGRDAVGDWFGDWFRQFERGYRFEVEEVRDLDHTILAATVHRGRGKRSGAEVRMDLVYLITVEDGLIARVQMFPDRDRALDAAGRTG